YFEKENYEEALKYHKLLKNWPDAGFYYYEGKGVPQSYENAIAYWESIAEENSISKMFLATAYYLGNGVNKDVNKAFELFSAVHEKWDSLSKHYKMSWGHLHTSFPQYAQDEALIF